MALTVETVRACITSLHRSLDQVEKSPDLAELDEAMRCLCLRLAGLRTIIMERRHYGEACARVDAMFPSMKEAAE